MAEMIKILEEANKVVLGSRHEQYGTAERNQDSIGEVWSALLRNAGLLKDGAQIDGDMVCIMMAGMKLCRLSIAPKHYDSQVDAVGYMALMSVNQQAQQD